MGATVFEIAGGGGGSARPPLVKGVGTKRLGKGRVKGLPFDFYKVERDLLSSLCSPIFIKSNKYCFQAYAARPFYLRFVAGLL